MPVTGVLNALRHRGEVNAWVGGAPRHRADVLNALRHRGEVNVHLREVMDDGEGCSTPYGIEAR